MVSRAGVYLIWGVVFVVSALGLWWLVRPKPVEVDTTAARRGALQVTVDQQGEVRVHDRYNLNTPVAGQLLRVEIHQGDRVNRDQVVAWLAAPPLDARQRDEAHARIAAARSRADEAARAVDKARAELSFAGAERSRYEQLATKNYVSLEAVERARMSEETAKRALQSATAREQAARADLRAAEATLLLGHESSAGADDAATKQPGAELPPGSIPLRVPADGHVLQLVEQSERTLPAGTTVMVVGDPARFELVADVLSTDAVRINAGAPVWIERWGGDQALRAKVRLVEPYAFTKVSALGIEEKRVNVIMDPIDSLAKLGDGYRVEARIVIWSNDDVLKVPANALFRVGEDWHLFVAEGDRLLLRKVAVSARNAAEAAIESGVQIGEQIVQYPANTLRAGMRVRARTQRAESGRRDQANYAGAH